MTRFALSSSPRRRWFFRLLAMGPAQSGVTVADEAVEVLVALAPR